MLRWNLTGLHVLLAVFWLQTISSAQEFPEFSFSRREDSGGTWPSFTTPSAREDWFDFKAEVDADKGLISRLAPGCRRSLADDGIDVFGWYMMAFQGNAVGGIDKEFEATGLNDFGLDFDFEKLCCQDGLSARISGSWAWGPNLTDEVGATIPVNTVFSGTAWRFFEMYFEQ